MSYVCHAAGETLSVLKNFPRPRDQHCSTRATHGKAGTDNGVKEQGDERDAILSMMEIFRDSAVQRLCAQAGRAGSTAAPSWACY